MKLNEKCLLKLTKNCFERMNNNLTSMEQTGGSDEDKEYNNDTIIPYFLSYGIKIVDKNSYIPLGLLIGNSDLTSKIKLGEYLDKNKIENINQILSQKPKDW